MPARYGKGGYNEWKENRVTDYDTKTEDYTEDYPEDWSPGDPQITLLGKPPYSVWNEYMTKDYDESEIHQGGEDWEPYKEKYPEHSEEVDYNNPSEELANNPEARADPAPQIESREQPVTYPSAAQEAKERTAAYLDGSKESANIYNGIGSTENNMVENPGEEMEVANNKATSIFQSRHTDRNLNFS